MTLNFVPKMAYFAVQAGADPDAPMSTGEKFVAWVIGIPLWTFFWGWAAWFVARQDSFLFACAAVAILAVQVVYFSGQARKYDSLCRHMKEATRSKVATAKAGYRELTGFCQSLGPPVRAPLTGKPCSWYYYKIGERVVIQNEARARGSGTTYRLIEEGCSRLFTVRDETGTCLVDIAGARVIPTAHEIWTSESREAGDTGTRRNLSDRPAQGRYLFLEGRFDIDDHVYLLGRFSTNVPAQHDNSGNVLEAPGRRMMRTEDLRKPFLVGSLHSSFAQHTGKAAKFLKGLAWLALYTLLIVVAGTLLGLQP